MSELLSWKHILAEAAIILVPSLIAGYLGFRQIMWTLTEFRPHRHQEKHGQLQASGIVYPRSMNGD